VLDERTQGSLVGSPDAAGAPIDRTLGEETSLCTRVQTLPLYAAPYLDEDAADHPTPLFERAQRRALALGTAGRVPRTTQDQESGKERTAVYGDPVEQVRIPELGGIASPGLRGLGIEPDPVGTPGDVPTDIVQ
jgi:hypothetical protein